MSKITDIGPYLKYYIGQQAQCFNGLEHERTGQIVEVSINSGTDNPVEVKCPSVKYPGKAFSYLKYDWFEVKPILRPLSDMTEEEAVEVAKLSEWEPHFRDVKVERTQYGDLVVRWDGCLEGGEVFNATGAEFYCQEQFHYLLSRGFDLFNLIESGLAIDSTKQNSTTNGK